MLVKLIVFGGIAVLVLGLLALFFAVAFLQVRQRRQAMAALAPALGLRHDGARLEGQRGGLAVRVSHTASGGRRARITGRGWRRASGRRSGWPWSCAPRAAGRRRRSGT